MSRLLRQVIFLLLLAAYPGLYGQLIPEEIKKIGGKYLAVAPTQLALSPTGDKIVISDRFANKIYVIDYRGEFLWAVGENVKLERPRAVAFVSDNEIIFTVENSSLIFKASENDPQSLDTIADLVTLLKRKSVIKQIIGNSNGDFLMLDEKEGAILFVSADWKSARTIVGNGQGKGKVWAPSQAALDFSGKIMVADLKNFPFQAFTPEGKFLFYGGWDKPGMDKGWEASAIAVDRQEQIIVADKSNAQLRVFDQSGREVKTVELGYAPVNITAITATVDGRLYLIDEFRGFLTVAWEN